MARSPATASHQRPLERDDAHRSADPAIAADVDPAQQRDVAADPRIATAGRQLIGLVVGGVFSSVSVDNVGTLTTIGGTSPTSLAAANSDNQIRVSSDRGATWQPASACWLPERLTVQAATSSTGLNDVCAGGGRTFIVGGGGTVLTSRDNVNWTSVPTGTSTSSWAAPSTTPGGRSPSAPAARSWR